MEGGKEERERQRDRVGKEAERQWHRHERPGLDRKESSPGTWQGKA